MARGSSGSVAVRGWVLGGAAVVIGAVAVVLTVMALAHVAVAPAGDETVAPVPTFSVEPSVTPTPTPTAGIAYDRALERFVAVGDGVLWRGTAGSCDADAPVLERSTDDGETWTDVTPTYLGIGQLSGLSAFAGIEAEIIAGMGDDCETQLLRTFTQGQFWAPYPDVLAGAAFIDPEDASSVIVAGETLLAPCADARGLRSSGETVALVCAGTAYVLADAEWAALPLADVAALALDGDVVAVAHRVESCAGLAVTLVAEDGEMSDAGCVAVSDTTAPAALAWTADYAVLWSGNDWMKIEP